MWRNAVPLDRCWRWTATTATAVCAVVALSHGSPAVVPPPASERELGRPAPGVVPPTTHRGSRPFVRERGQ